MPTPPPRRGPKPKPARLLVSVDSDGTLDGTRVTLPGGRELSNVQAVDVHLDAAGATCTVRIGQVAIDYGPAAVELTDAALDVEPGPSPRETR